MFNSYRDPASCYGNQNNSVYPQNVVDNGKTGQNSANCAPGTWGLATSHLPHATGATHPHSTSPYHSAFHHHTNTMDYSGYTMSQKEKDVLSAKERLRCPPTNGNSSVNIPGPWQSNRNRYPSNNPTSGGAFLPYPTQISHYEGQLVESSTHSHARKSIWGTPGPPGNTYPPFIGQSYPREMMSFVENHHSDMSSSIIRHTTNVTGIELTPSQQLEQQQQQQIHPHHPQVHQQTQPVYGNHQAHETLCKLVQKEREACRLPAYQGAVRHSVVRNHTTPYQDHLYQPDQYGHPQDLLRKSQIPAAGFGERRSAFTARQSSTYPLGWNKSPVSYLPFEPVLPSHRSSGSAFQPCNKIPTDGSLYSSDGMMWSKSHQTGHPASSHISVQSSGHPGQSPWLQNPATPHIFPSRQSTKQGLASSPLSTNMINLDTGQIEPARLSSDHGSILPMQYQPSLTQHHIPQQHLMQMQPALRHYQQSQPHQMVHQPSPCSNSQMSPMMPSPHQSMQSPQMASPCAQQQHHDQQRLAANDESPDFGQSAEDGPKSDSGKTRSSKQCIDVRQFLSTWDEDTDIATPRPACIEENESMDSEIVLNNTEGAPLVVLHCRDLQGEEAANLLQVYPSVEINGIDGTAGIVTCSNENLFSGSSEGNSMAPQPNCSAELENLLDHNCDTRPNYPANSPTLEAPAASPHCPTTQALDSILRSSLSSQPLSDRNGSIPTDLTTGNDSSKNSNLEEPKSVVVHLRENNSDFDLLSYPSQSFTPNTMGKVNELLGEPSPKLDHNQEHNMFSTQVPEVNSSSVIQSNSAQTACIPQSDLRNPVRRSVSVISTPSFSCDTPTESDKDSPPPCQLAVEIESCFQEKEMASKTFAPIESVPSPALSDASTDSRKTTSLRAFRKRKFRLSEKLGDSQDDLDDSFQENATEVPEKSCRFSPVDEMLEHNNSTTPLQDRSKWAFTQIHENAGLCLSSASSRYFPYSDLLSSNDNNIVANSNNDSSLIKNMENNPNADHSMSKKAFEEENITHTQECDNQSSIILSELYSPPSNNDCQISSHIQKTSDYGRNERPSRKDKTPGSDYFSEDDFVFGESVLQKPPQTLDSEFHTLNSKISDFNCNNIENSKNGFSKETLISATENSTCLLEITDKGNEEWSQKMSELDEAEKDCSENVTTQYLSRIVTDTPGKIPKILLSRLDKEDIKQQDKEEPRSKKRSNQKLKRIILTRVNCLNGESDSDPHYVCSESGKDNENGFVDDSLSHATKEVASHEDLLQTASVNDSFEDIFDLGVDEHDIRSLPEENQRSEISNTGVMSESNSQLSPKCQTNDSSKIPEPSEQGSRSTVITEVVETSNQYKDNSSNSVSSNLNSENLLSSEEHIENADLSNPDLLKNNVIDSDKTGESNHVTNSMQSNTSENSETEDKNKENRTYMKNDDEKSKMSEARSPQLDSFSRESPESETVKESCFDSSKTTEAKTGKNAISESCFDSEDEAQNECIGVSNCRNDFDRRSLSSPYQPPQTAVECELFDEETQSITSPEMLVNNENEYQTSPLNLELETRNNFICDQPACAEDERTSRPGEEFSSATQDAKGAAEDVSEENLSDKLSTLEPPGSLETVDVRISPRNTPERTESGSEVKFGEKKGPSFSAKDRSNSDCTEEQILSSIPCEDSTKQNTESSSSSNEVIAQSSSVPDNVEDTSNNSELKNNSQVPECLSVCEENNESISKDITSGVFIQNSSMKSSSHLVPNDQSETDEPDIAKTVSEPDLNKNYFFKDQSYSTSPEGEMKNLSLGSDRVKNANADVENSIESHKSVQNTNDPEVNVSFTNSTSKVPISEELTLNDRNRETQRKSEQPKEDYNSYSDSMAVFPEENTNEEFSSYLESTVPETIISKPEDAQLVSCSIEIDEESEESTACCMILPNGKISPQKEKDSDCNCFSESPKKDSIADNMKSPETAMDLSEKSGSSIPLCNGTESFTENDDVDQSNVTISDSVSEEQLNDFFPSKVVKNRRKSSSVCSETSTDVSSSSISISSSEDDILEEEMLYSPSSAFPDPESPGFDVSRIPLPEECEERRRRLRRREMNHSRLTPKQSLIEEETISAVSLSSKGSCSPREDSTKDLALVDSLSDSSTSDLVNDIDQMISNISQGRISSTESACDTSQNESSEPTRSVDCSSPTTSACISAELPTLEESDNNEKDHSVLDCNETINDLNLQNDSSDFQLDLNKNDVSESEKNYTIDEESNQGESVSLDDQQLPKNDPETESGGQTLETEVDIFLESIEIETSAELVTDSANKNETESNEEEEEVSDFPADPGKSCDGDVHVEDQIEKLPESEVNDKQLETEDNGPENVQLEFGEDESTMEKGELDCALEKGELECALEKGELECALEKDELECRQHQDGLLSRDSSLEDPEPTGNAVECEGASAGDDLPALEAPVLDALSQGVDCDSDREMPFLEPMLSEHSRRTSMYEDAISLLSVDVSIPENIDGLDDIDRNEQGFSDHECSNACVVDVEDKSSASRTDCHICTNKSKRKVVPYSDQEQVVEIVEDQGSCSEGVSRLEISNIRTVPPNEVTFSPAVSMDSSLVACSDIMPVQVDSVYNWPYVEEVFSESTDALDHMTQREWTCELGNDGRPQLRCSLPWQRILLRGERMVLGPAKIQFRLNDNPGTGNLSWNVVDHGDFERLRRNSAESIGSFQEENNNIFLSGSPSPRSPLVVMKTLVLKRPNDDRLRPGVKTKGALKSFTLDPSLRSDSHWSEIGPNKRRRVSSTSSRQSRSSVRSASGSDVSAGEVPRLLLKRTGAGTTYKSFLQHSGLQPIVVLRRDAQLDQMARRSTRRLTRSSQPAVEIETTHMEDWPNSQTDSVSEANDLFSQVETHEEEEEEEKRFENNNIPDGQHQLAENCSSCWSRGSSRTPSTDYDPSQDSPNANWIPWSGVYVRARGISQVPVDEPCGACGASLTGETRAQHVRTHLFCCQTCETAYTSQDEFVRHLATIHPKTQERHHCLLCQRTFPSEQRHARHVKGWNHRLMERAQRRTIHTLFRMFTGADCPTLEALQPEDMAPEWPPNEDGFIHFYHQGTPLQLAIQDCLYRKGILHQCRKHRLRSSAYQSLL